MLNWFILPFSFIPVDICGPENTDQLHEVSGFSVVLLAQLLHSLHLSIALAAVLVPAQKMEEMKTKQIMCWAERGWGGGEDIFLFALLQCNLSTATSLLVAFKVLLIQFQLLTLFRQI